jgi:putative nucleotidyltransferase with HDIG domain
LAALSSAIEARDPYARGHSSRVTVFAQAMARGLRLDKERISVLRLGALLHDVGKLVVPSSVLLKRGPLTDEELGQMRRHPAAGARMLRSLGAPETILPLVLHHHERWDGAGYPDGLAGQGIPLSARIFSVCDTLEAMTARRPYREPVPASAAMAEIHGESGRQFDPSVVDALERGVTCGDIDLADTLGVASAGA